MQNFRRMELLDRIVQLPKGHDFPPMTLLVIASRKLDQSTDRLKMRNVKRPSERKNPRYSATERFPELSKKEFFSFPIERGREDCRRLRVARQ